MCRDNTTIETSINENKMTTFNTFSWYCFLTQQLHTMQLRFLEAVHRELVNLDEDSKRNMSIPALLEPLPPPPAAEHVLEVDDVEPQLGADDL